MIVLLPAGWSFLGSGLAVWARRPLNHTGPLLTWTTPRPLPTGPLSVEFGAVRFGYPAADKVSLASLEDIAQLDVRAGDEVLHGVSFRAEPGQLVALVGSSGAGKSTIAQLLPRLYDVDAGVVCLGGVDVRQLSFDTIRATLGLVTQDGHLFHESIAGHRARIRWSRPVPDSSTMPACARGATRSSPSHVRRPSPAGVADRAAARCVQARR